MSSVRRTACLVIVLGVLVGDARGGGLPATGFEESTVVDGLSLPTGIAWLPDDRMLVTQLSGELVLVDGGQATVLARLDVCTLLENGFEGETGLLGIAVHPDFPDDRSIFLYRTRDAGSAFDCFDALLSLTLVNEVVKVTLAANDTVDLATLETVYTGIGAESGFHNGGALRIGPTDRKLYVAVGDNAVGDEDEPPGNSTNPYAQDLGRPEGKILRLNLDGSAPPDNPFVGQGGALEEIFAYGFRNPWRMGFDHLTGNLWVGDVGEVTIEEIDVVPPGGGGNYGWPRCEGTQPAGCRQPGDVDPVLTYPHSGPEALGDSVTGGAFADGGAMAAYDGQYFFADFGDDAGFAEGTIYHVPLTPDRSAPAAAPAPVITQAGGPVDVVFGGDGALYYVAFLDGAVRRVTASEGPGPGPVDDCTTIPECQAALDAVLPDPATAADKKSRRTAKKLGRLARKADGLLEKAAAATGKKQAKRYRKARKALDKLSARATKADDRGQLGVPLNALQTAVDALLALIPAT